MKSSFPGCIEEIPFIRVDDFNERDQNAYFLSHFHGDHVQGLNRLSTSRLAKNKAFLYASKVTNAIIEMEYPDLSPYLRNLDLGSNTISVLRDGKEIFLNVKMLPAGHSLGSVMFLFEYNNLNILYTGDFRLTRNTVSNYAHFHSNGEPIRLDVLYVDTTFQDWPCFPRRSDVVRNVVYHIKKWLDKGDDRRVLLRTSAAYGYEYVCNEIYNETGIKSYASAKYWQVYSQFPKDINGITDDPTSKIRLLNKFERNMQKNELELIINFSAWKWTKQKQVKNIEEDYIKLLFNEIDVCFSTHCGRDELMFLIKYLNPKKIVGFPDPYNANNDIILKQDGFPSPESVAAENFKITPKKRNLIRNADAPVDKKVCKNLLKEAFDW